MDQSEARMDQTQSYRGLKALLIGMGVLIIIGTAVVVGVIIHRTYVASTRSRPVSPIAGPVPAPPSVPAFHIMIPVPPGSSIKTLVAIDHRLAVQLATPNGDRIILINPRTGAITGRLTLGQGK